MCQVPQRQRHSRHNTVTELKAFIGVAFPGSRNGAVEGGRGRPGRGERVEGPLGG